MIFDTFLSWKRDEVNTIVGGLFYFPLASFILLRSERFCDLFPGLFV